MQVCVVARRLAGSKAPGPLKAPLWWIPLGSRFDCSGSQRLHEAFSLATGITRGSTASFVAKATHSDGGTFDPARLDRCLSAIAAGAITK